MKNILRLLFFFILITSCEDNLNINDNPNTPVDVDKSFVLTAAQGSLATGMGGQLANLGGFLAQYHTQPPSAAQYLSIDTYNMNVDFSDRLWNELWAGALNDLNFVMSESEAEGDTGSFLIASLLRVYTLQVLTDLYGDIPYSEALLGSANITPNPDFGGDIYTGLVSEINTSLSKYSNTPVQSTVGAQDAVYNSDMDEWVKFANTLKLKLYIRMAYTSQADASAVTQLLAENNFITSDAKFAIYEDSQNKANPFYDVQIDNLGDVNNIASKSLLSFLQNNGDPRDAAIYRKNDDDPAVFRGIDQGDRDNYTAEVAKAFSRPNITATTPVYFITVAESNFLQAEALIRYSGGTGAKEKYDTGIVNSFLTYGLDPSLANPLIDTGGVYEYVPSGDIETALRQVMIQKWVSLANVNNIEGFFESNRTQYPETVALGDEDYTLGNFVASVGSVLTGIQTPNTLFYPDTEITKNPNITQKASLTEKVWWDQK
ncbi:SusD/RagB family nutrient-binding outer membrane lipoprotein [Algibacter sp. TI.3.09]|uniref:SusD/RagB family nutrient-binding outer membrane lipoprotein n=1 Tax=Algibacter sp. TI.3.09 TaxID=3121298 RepID=UPI00311E62E6